MNISTISRVSSISLLASAICMSTQISAQDKNKLTNNGDIEVIMVSAQKRLQSVQEVPISMSAFSGDMIKQIGATDFKGLTDVTPGFSVVGGSDAFPRSYIRGVGSNDTGVGVDPSVGIYIDGIYAFRNGGALTDLMDIERIEILKGPQGTLFGRNSIGGAISIVTAKPTEDLSGEIALELGNYNSQVVKGLINIPLIDDSLYVRASGVVRKRDGWQENKLSSVKGNSRDRASGRLKFTWYPHDDIEVNQSNGWSRFDEVSTNLENYSSVYPIDELAQVHDDKKMVNGGLDFWGNSNNDQAPLVPILDRRVRDHSLSVDWFVNDGITFTSLSAYRTFTTFNTSDYDGTEYYFGENEGSKEHNETISQEFRLSGASDSLDWFIGTSYSHERNKMDFLIGLFDFGPLIGSNLNNGAPFLEDSQVRTVTDSFAVYGDATWHVNDKLNLTVGARYSSDDKSIHYNNPIQTQGAVNLGGLGFVMPIASQFVDENGIPNPAYQHLDDDWDDFSPRFVVDYKLSDDAMIYGSVTMGYKSGGFNTYPSPATDSGFIVTPDATASVDPELATSYELGLKSTWLDDDLTLNASLFVLDYEDLQVREIVGTVVQLANAGKATNQGLEFDMNYQVTSDLAVVLNGTWMDAEYDEYISGGVDLAGTPLLYSPNFEGSVALDYFKEIEGAGELRGFISIAYKGDHQIHETLEQEAYTTVSARLSLLTQSDWEFAIFGSNLTDEVFLNSYTGQMNTFGLVAVTRNEPRTFGISATYSFY